MKRLKGLIDPGSWRAAFARDRLRLGVAGIATLVTYGIGFGLGLGRGEGSLLLYNLSILAFASSYLAMTVIAFYGMTPEATRDWARKPRDSDSPWYIRWTIGEALGSSFVSGITSFAFVGALLMITSDRARTEYLVVGALVIVTSWLMLHVSMALYYAWAYFSAGGLSLTDESDPDMLDFAYLAFTIGTTFTTADARITDRRLRRAVLGHGLLSFAFNTVLLGLVVAFLAA